MAYKIESAQWTIPVTGLQYTDVRPVIAGDTLEDIIEGARSVSKAVGNDKLYERLGGAQTGLGGAPASSQRIMGDGVLFNESDHTYTKDGKQYLSGSTFAHMFEKDFPRDAIAQKVADKNGNEVEDILAAWDAKGDISLKYGTLIHKCIESYLAFGVDAKPTNQYLADIIGDWDDVFGDLFGKSGAPEYFVQDDAHQLCGVIDFWDMDGHDIYDWKTGDIHQKISHTLGKEWPSDRLSLYTLQLNFYKYICEQNGHKIRNLYIGWLNGDHWEKIKVDTIDIKPYLEQVWKPTK